MTYGQLITALCEFCCVHKARHLDELLISKAYADLGTERFYFITRDFMAYLLQRHHAGEVVEDRWVLANLMDLGLRVHSGQLKGYPVTYYSLPLNAIKDVEDTSMIY